MDLPQEIMDLLKKKASMPHDYVNPHFLQGITELLDSYYNLQDAKVDKWMYNMWSS